MSDIGSDIMDIGSEILNSVTPHPTESSSLESTESDLFWGLWKELINEMPAPPRPRDPKQNLFGIDVSELEPLSKTEYDMLYTACKGLSGVVLPITAKAVVLRGSVARQLKRKGITSVAPRIYWAWEPLRGDIKDCLPILKNR